MGRRYPESSLDLPVVSEQLTLAFALDPMALACSEHVHRWYDYVQGFEPELVARKVREHVPGENGVVLDPFCGSGTTLVSAQFLGHQAIRVDANPLMCLVSEAKSTWDAPLGQLKSRAVEVLSALEDKIRESRDAEPPACAIPMKSVNKWFVPAVLREVVATRDILAHLPPEIEPGTVDLIFTSPPYPTDIEYTRQTRAELYFLDFIETMDDVRAIKKRMVRGSPKNIYKTDNNEQRVSGYRKVQDASAAIHEMTKDKNWGWDYARMVREYFGDMHVCLQECLRVLKPGGWALLVVGDQTCKGVKIPVTDVLLRIGLDLGFADSYVEQVRERRSTTHSMSLPERILAFRRNGRPQKG